MKGKIITHFSAVGAKGEIYKGHISMTEPGKGMTAREVMQRSAVGLPLDGGKVPIYRGDQIYPEFDRLDHQEQFEIIQKVKREMKERNLKAHQEGKQRYDKAIADRVIEEFKKAQAEKLANEATQQQSPES